MREARDCKQVGSLFNRYRAPRGPGAAGEGVFTDVDWPGWQRDFGQGRALAEGAISNLGEFGRQRDLSQGRAGGAPGG